ncbi:MAG: ABC transporter substrate-binding protein [Deltaproteobacteria bacterium]|nr:ABC transporter substrate-binding protein [Deltaproteobacteria bacterium]
MRKTVWLVLAFLIFPIFLEAADKIRVSISSVDIAFLTGGVALKKGFFKEEGLDAELIRMNANVSITALATGDTDYTLIFGSVVRAAMRGLPVRVVAGFMDGSTHTLISRPEFKTVKDLKGRTLGISSFGATADVAARMMIKHYGIDPEKEMKIIALGPDRARFAALKEEVVDVAVISPPADAEGKKLGFNVLARAYELFSFPFIGLGANVKKIKEKPDEVKRAIKALIKANRYIRQNRDGAIQVLAEFSRSGKENATASYDSSWKVFNLDGSIPEDGLRLVIDQAKQALKIDREVSASEVSDITPLREAQKELGIKGR